MAHPPVNSRKQRQKLNTEITEMGAQSPQRKGLASGDEIPKQQGEKRQNPHP